MSPTQQIASESFLEGKDEQACTQIAQRVGLHLCNEAISEVDRRAAELLARALADDAIETVRVELSRAIGRAKYLPRDLALKLAHDVDSVACPFLEVTEVFSDRDWHQLILTISRGARMAVARRSTISEALANLLAEVGDAPVAEALIENAAAPMTQIVCNTLMDRFSSETWVLDKLALRDDLISEIAVRLTTIVSAAARKKLEATYKQGDFTEPVAAEAEMGALLQVVKKTPKSDLLAVAETLHKKKKLSPVLVLKAIQEKYMDFIEAALSVMAGRSLEHVRSVILRAGPDAVNQLLGKAGIPSALHEDFWKEIQVLRRKH